MLNFNALINVATTLRTVYSAEDCLKYCVYAWETITSGMYRRRPDSACTKAVIFAEMSPSESVTQFDCTLPLSLTH